MFLTFPSRNNRGQTREGFLYTMKWDPIEQLRPYIPASSDLKTSISRWSTITNGIDQVRICIFGRIDSMVRDNVQTEFSHFPKN